MYNVVDYLENAANLYPNKKAIVEENKFITYKELDEYSKCVGSYFANKNIFNEPIIIFMDKGIDTLISFFGAVYAGCFYSLINPELPEVRINQIKDVISSKYVITNKDNLELARSCFRNLTILDIEELKKSKISEPDLSEAYNKHIDTDPLYVNFTSGSTGIPKGVVINHKSVIDFINIFTETFPFTKDEILANQAPFDFDVSVKDIYTSLSLGATLVIVPKKYFSNPSMLLDYICDAKVTTLIWAVSALCLITTFHGLDYKVPESVNKILFSGEVMPIKHLNIWMNHLPNTEFINLYGPTEITCNCTYYVIDKNKSYTSIPIGIPFKNERVFLLDENDSIITEKNKSGEICVAGSCLGLGYYNNKSQTDAHFINNPNVNSYSEKIYRTGDLAYYDDDLNLVFNGRKDFQIKYQGHRIELEEIDGVVNKIDGVSRSVTLFDEEKSRLYNFYIGSISSDELYNILKNELPVFMLPTRIKQVDNFPLTKNGKVDRSSLMEMK